MAAATLTKWGNAQGIRIPQVFCDQMGVGVGDALSLWLDGDKLVIQKSTNQYTLHERLKGWNQDYFVSEECDWGNPVGNEMW